VTQGRYALIREQIVGRWVLSNPRPTARKLADDFGVSIKTVRSVLAPIRPVFERPLSEPGLKNHDPQSREDVDTLVRALAILMERLRQAGAT
jgi:hypothetical protein